VFKTKTKTLHLKTKTKTFLWCILEVDRKAFFILGHKRKCRRKWNPIYGWKRNENRHSFSTEKRKRKSLDNISVFFFFIHSVTKSALQCAPWTVCFHGLLLPSESNFPQDQMFKTKNKTKTSWSKTKTKTMTFIFVLEAPWDQDPGLEDYITGNN